MNKNFFTKSFHSDVLVFESEKKCNQFIIFNRCKRSKSLKRYQLLGKFENEDITVKGFCKKYFYKVYFVFESEKMYRQFTNF